MAAHNETLFAAWMDGRFDDGTFSRTDVWVAASTDGGLSFGPNVRVNVTEAGYNGQPALAIDANGRLHLAWDADDGAGTLLYYATSDDGGLTFSAPRVVVSGDGRGRLGNAVLSVSDAGQVYLGWSDASGVHLTML